MSTELTDTSPITKTVLVDCTVEHAFEVFTARIAEWWPLETHSIFKDEVDTVMIEPHEGGELYELSRNGERGHWATVTAWDPPHRMMLSWRVNPTTPAPTEIEVTFAPEADGKTLVTLEHRGWELLGPDLGAQERQSYHEGWDRTLGCYADVANA
ncbi:MAG: hypothetical protein QOF68_1681 [Gaiellales bacterium]|jgi:uncharacterized protein YndB with AHSA1/START domain|nr:hypothetical protein [Gaiellales bacterium]